ncbi:translation initiation factor IF-2 [Candidatus Nitrosocosmicus franklandus]|uniref:Probable translation initiation factor IF-2 n=1 Tax=Candidatus Nitrosocosmicus franklandianus TaxID=1798806 RepID=A0A484I8Y5_9ARCH|nr:translation initiation factor IF-2 [Candidatus Nitrosocosmicus franklandus]VFJ14221.1 putative translation initiation factor IF-2 [Candidatus Nitrosocosmicus franklandus]
MHLRQPVVVVLGHVDSGKTSLLDKIRGTFVQSREAGGITQHIGASFFPIEIIQQLTGPLSKKLTSHDNSIPGLLVIDTPGHEVFANLRMRGGSAADIAIVVVDVNKGFEPQTIESINILKNRKVPFVVAINKIDRITGWKKGTTNFITNEIKIQPKEVQLDLDNKMYSVLGSLSQLGFSSEAFWRVKDFTKEVALVPVSASNGVGIPELLTVLVGLTQQFMAKKLERHEGSARGIVLEVNEEIGLGPSANVILLDGVIKQGDTIVVAKRDTVVSTRIKSLLLPKPLDEMRDPRDKFRQVKTVISAAGLKITSPDLEGVIAGSPLYGLSSPNDETRIKSLVESEVKSALINTDSNGIILRCDTIGSIEAISEMLRKENIPIRSADIGHISRKDVMTASAVKEKDRYLGVILGFNVKILDDAEKESIERDVKIFNEKVIYNLVRSYKDWVSYQKDHEDSILFNELPPVCKFEFMKGYVFRRSDPAVFGAEINIGRMKQKMPIMNPEGKKVGVIHQIQDKGKSIEEATRGMQVAVSVNGPQIGRQINEGDIFYTYLDSRQAKLLINRFNNRLDEEEKMVLDLIVSIRRKTDPAFGYI